MIKTITRNLLSNAIKFTPSNGTVQISAAPVEGKVIVSIKDTGVGIEPEKIPLLFDFTNNITTFGTDGEKGTGLGLSLCHDLISLNHGKIQVESTPGEGSIFSFTIPLRQG
jgi:signal transduction histidine kinase